MTIDPAIILLALVAVGAIVAAGYYFRGRLHDSATLAAVLLGGAILFAALYPRKKKAAPPTDSLRLDAEAVRDAADEAETEGFLLAQQVAREAENDGSLDGVVDAWKRRLEDEGRGCWATGLTA